MKNRTLPDPDPRLRPAEETLPFEATPAGGAARQRLAATVSRSLSQTPSRPVPVQAAQPARSGGGPRSGMRLGRFTLTETLGEGYSAIVFRAHHEMLDIDVALKVLLNRDMGERERRCVYREANLLARLNHPNIIRLLDFDILDGYHVLILEYVDGTSLRSLIDQQEDVDQALLVTMMRQVAVALGYAHGRGVIHNDIKPANILLTREGDVRVADLGMARVLRGGSTEISGGHSMVAGTPAYVSPEMVQRGLAAADHRSDIYSLGVTMYQCLAGRLPFTQPALLELLAAHVGQRPTPLAEVRPAVDESLSTLVDCMMAKNPAERPQSYEELNADLGVIAEALHRAVDHGDRNDGFGVIFGAGGDTHVGPAGLRARSWLDRLLGRKRR